MTTTSTARAVINLDLPGPVISRHLYGHFAEHLGRCIYGGIWVGEDSPIPNAGGIRLDVVDALKAIRIPNLRWPGGCFADEYHWADGIGPRESRPRMVNTHWGDVEENNHFGTHEFLALCELLGADPYLSGNLGSGTVREMSDWVEYLTRDGDAPMSALRKANGRDRPWRIPFWGLGNEPWGCGGNFTAEVYVDEARRYSTYCRNHGGNQLYKIAAGANSKDYHWTETLMKNVSCLGCTREPHRFFHALSLHHYTINGSWDDKGHATDFDLDDFHTTMLRVRQFERILRGHVAIMDSYDPEHHVGLVVDEWGTWWDVEPGTNPGFLYQQNTLRDALVASTHLDLFHQHADRVVMANIAQTVNVLQAMILTDPESDQLVLTPTYHVYAMNLAHHDAASLTVHLDAPDAVRTVDGESIATLSASASTMGDTALVSLSNLDGEVARTLLLDLRGRTVTGHTTTILTADRPQAHNTFAAPDVVSPSPYDGVSAHPRGLVVELPPHSCLTVSLTLGE